ncbi:MAG TPA: ThuA domain-containing protein [Polyangia bacterium]|nr:ThuA domain-containing protein [Polyangia bacterium]
MAMRGVFVSLVVAVPLALGCSSGGAGSATPNDAASGGAGSPTGTAGSGGGAGTLGGSGGGGNGGGAGGAMTSDGSADLPLADAPGADIGGPVTTDSGVDNGMPISRPATVLIFTRATGFVHGSTPVAADTIASAATKLGVTAEISADPAKFTPAALAKYGAVVLVATSGEPFGSPGTAAIDALVAFVKGGGGLVGIENATNTYNNSDTYVSLFGAVFAGHPEINGTCIKAGDHASVKNLPASFPVVDEIYAFTRMRADNQIVLRCGRGNYPVSWYREEGSGRIFYTAMGHNDANWTRPPLVDGHVIPGLLWTLGR